MKTKTWTSIKIGIILFCFFCLVGAALYTHAEKNMYHHKYFIVYQWQNKKLWTGGEGTTLIYRTCKIKNMNDIRDMEKLLLKENIKDDPNNTVVMITNWKAFE